MKKTLRNVILFDDNEIRKHLMPFTYTRPTALLRVGITTIAEKWQALLGEANYTSSRRMTCSLSLKKTMHC